MTTADEKILEEFDLNDYQCDRLVAITMDKLASKHGMHAIELNTSIDSHHSLRRSIVRAAHQLGAAQYSERIKELEQQVYPPEGE